ncbi:hypothetical protein ACVFI8_04880 [Agarivorans sp. MS3-6]|uniref:hypothetical protein n=1 Tax=Agarivorans sp. TSD2052 TaxID=2937286 RepID=UPI00200CAFB3|nr:hypothetical protein [Agarivorans sp. TSD2052]UPW19664.1 hypothetical protein M0C34_05125 [Agarivorans sp. TSD2052]
MRNILVTASALVLSLTASFPIVAAEQPSVKPDLSEFDKNAKHYNKSLVKEGYRFGCRLHDESGKCVKLQWKKLK